MAKASTSSTVAALATLAAAVAPSAVAEGAPYLVTSPLNHDGEPYKIGDTITLTEAQAAPLLGVAISLAPADAPGDAPGAVPGAVPGDDQADGSGEQTGA